MDDAELSALIRRFQSLQREQVSAQITERNAVEIVNALVQKKLIDILFTTDAKDYLTWDELKREIVDEVLASGGRVNVVDLPGQLSVHTFHVERVLPSVLEENPSLTLESGELMTDGYLDSIVLAAWDLLKEHGSLAISQFASTNQLSSLFAKNILSRAMDSGRIDCVLQDGSLYTKQFVNIQRMVVRAGLLAVQEPVRLDTFYRRHKLFAPLLNSVVDKVRSELPGSFDGYNTYIPRVYETKRAAEVENLYTSNGYIEYAVLQQRKIINPRHYLAERYNPPDTAAAEQLHGVAGSSTATLSSNQRRGRKKGQGTKMPVASREHVASRNLRADAEHPFCGYLLTNGFVSDRYLSNLPALQALIDKEVLVVDIVEQLPLFVEMDRDWSVLESRLGELYPGLESAALIASTVLLSAEAQERFEAAFLIALANSQKSKVPVSTVAIETLASVLKLPRERYGEVLQELLDRWGDLVEALEEKNASATAQDAASQLKRSRSALQEELATRWVHLWLTAKGFEWALAQLDEPTSATIARHIMSTEAYEMARQVIRNESLDTLECSKMVAAALEQVTQPAQLVKALLPFSESRRSSLMPLVDSLKGKALGTFVDVLREMSGTGVIAVASFHPPNKKTEREGYVRVKESVVHAVATASVSRGDVVTNGKLLSLLCTMLIHQHFHCHVDVPGKAVAGVVCRLKLEAGVPSTLEGAKEAVIIALQRGTVDEAGAVELEELRASTLALS